MSAASRNRAENRDCLVLRQCLGLVNNSITNSRKKVYVTVDYSYTR